MIDDRNFALELGHPWRHLPNDDPEHYHFHDEARDIDITVSAIALDIAAEAIDQFVNVLVDTRLRAESDTARVFDRQMMIYEPVVVPRPWGQAVAYYGHDDTGRQFGFSGMVTPRSAISLYMSTGRLSERELIETMDEIGSRIVFDRTPLNVVS